MPHVLRTAAWYGDDPLELPMPASWQVETFWPNTPPPLTDDEIGAALAQPVGQLPIRELARGKARPLLIVDDLTRPTPAARIIPHVLGQLREAGIPPEAVRILVATGTHGAPPRLDTLAQKVGPAAAPCTLLVHDARHGAVRVGRTSYGSPVWVNPEVLASDLLVGIGGVYPQHSVGFGGGSKLLLGTLGLRSIVALHYGHPSMNGSLNTDNDFRHDLDEMAEMVGFRTSISVHVDAGREVVRVVCGDPRAYYREAVAFSREAFAAPLPEGADVVVANAYPIDVSLTFMRSKGIIPLLHAPAGASRILVSACSEGVGYHGLFPFMNAPRFQRELHLLRRLSTKQPRDIPGKVAQRVLARLRARRGRGPGQPRPQHTHPIWLYVPRPVPGGLPDGIPEMTATYHWLDLVAQIQREQGRSEGLRVAIYPCAPLHALAAAPARGNAAERSATVPVGV